MSAEGQKGRDYLKSRGITKKGAKYFGIGYANEGYFSDRVTFPIISDGEVKNITSRLISKYKTDKSHLHLPKIKMDWFFHEKAIEKYGDSIVIVESPINCVTMIENGFMGCIAVMGANNFNRVKAMRLEKVKKVYICFDNDLNNAGDKAAVRVAHILHRCTGIEAMKMTVPFILGPDINDMYLTSKKSFKGRIKKMFETAIEIEMPKKKKYAAPVIGNIKFDIMELVQKYVELQPYGEYRFKAQCPLHSEKEPSFYVNAYTNRWTCFGCGAGGDAIDFLRAIEASNGKEIGFKEAIKILKN